MKKNMNSLIMTIVMLLLVGTVIPQSVNVEAWTQFRGISKDGNFPDSELPSWTEKTPEFAWKKKVGSGFPEIVVSGDIFYIHFGDSISETHGEFVMGCEVATGKEIWKTELDSLYIDPEKWGNGPRATPAIDENNIYCFTAYGKLIALSRKDGEIVWKVDVIKELGGSFPRYAYTSSPLISDNILFLETGGKEEKAFTAFDPKTGKVLWSKKNGRSSYCSPIVAEINNEKNIVMVFDSMLYSFDLKGNVKWEYKMPIRYPTAVPVFISPNKFFISNVSPIGSFVIKVEDNIVTEIFNSPTMKNNWSSSVYHDGHIYGFNSSKLQCNSMEDGSVKWSQRGFGKGSLIIVGDKLLVLSDKGVLKLVNASPEGYLETGSVQALEGKSWTAPSYANGRVFLRNLTEMSCYIIK